MPRLNPDVAPHLNGDVVPHLNPDVVPQLNPDVAPRLSADAAPTLSRVAPQLGQSLGTRLPSTSSNVSEPQYRGEGTSVRVFNARQSDQQAESIFSSRRARTSNSSTATREARDSLAARLRENRATAPGGAGRITTPSTAPNSRTTPDRSASQSEALRARLRESDSRRSIPSKNSRATASREARGSAPTSYRALPSNAETPTRSEALLRERIDARRNETTAERMPSINDGRERERVAGREIERSPAGLLPRLQDYAHRSGRPLKGDAARFLDERIQRRPQIVYRDRPDLVKYSPRTVYVYRDPYDRLCERIIWPQYYYPVYYSYGSYLGFHCVYPYYQRKYVFVSLGGYWPTYNYMRYYWYGYHPYSWYGYYPVPRQVDSDTYNYYTYNYYGDSRDNYADTGYYANDTGYSDMPYGISAQTYAKVQQRVAEQKAQAPAAQTQVDTLFDAGVQSFEAGNFPEAADQFGAAMELAPEDTILPYAYAQSLFAAGRYNEAAVVLRKALAKVSPADEGVFYPRGLYSDDDVLFEQIEDLLNKVEDYGFDADMQLLLGYNLLGIGENEYARGPLERAAQDARNAGAAKVLLDLLVKLETATGSSTGSTVDLPSMSQAGASAAAPAQAEAAQAGTETTGQASTGAALVAVTPEPEADTNDASVTPAPAGIDINVPSRPVETEPAGEAEPEPLDVVPEAVGSGSVGLLPAEQVGEGARAAGLLSRSATPAMIGLIAGAVFCLVHADLLSRRRVQG